MEIIVKVIIIGIISSILCLVIGKGAPELALCLAICTTVVLAIYAVGVLSGVIDFIEEIVEAAGLNWAIVSPILKVAGIGILTKLAGDVCSDSGQSAVASAVELAGTGAAIYVALPLMRVVFAMIEELL